MRAWNIEAIPIIAVAGVVGKNWITRIIEADTNAPIAVTGVVGKSWITRILQMDTTEKITGAGVIGQDWGARVSKKDTKWMKIARIVN